MAQELRALAVIPEDPGLIPRVSNTIIQIYMQEKHQYTLKKKEEKGEEREEEGGEGGGKIILLFYCWELRVESKGI